MSGNEYNVSWGKYTETVLNNLQKLVTDNVFADVTLVCEDGQYIQAHKAVLSLNSSFFHNILTIHKHVHPLVYLDSFNYGELKRLVEYMYLGETNVAQDDLNKFLMHGQKLKLKGMMDFKVEQGNVPTELEEIVLHCEKDDMPSSLEPPIKQPIEKTLKGKEDYQPNAKIELEETGKYSHYEAKIDPLIKEMGEAETKITSGVKKIKNSYIRHENEDRIASEENQAKAYHCSLCDYSSFTSASLKYHRRCKHDGVRYPCKTCDYSATSLSSLRRHRRNVHDREKFPCSTCSFQGSSTDSLKQHIKSQHEGVRLPCSKCDYEATQMGKLRNHMRKNHSL